MADNTHLLLRRHECSPAACEAARLTSDGEKNAPTETPTDVGSNNEATCAANRTRFVSVGDTESKMLSVIILN